MSNFSDFLPLKLDTNSIKLSDIPTGTGIYIFRDKAGKALYVGKAKNLRNRLASYFRQEDKHDPRIALMLRQAVTVEYALVESETAALILENNLIKANRPCYNVRLRDDKTFPYVRITNEPFPRILVVRRPIRDGSKYLGPYSDVSSLRQTLKFLNTIIPYRTCKRVINPGDKQRPCLNHQINRCLAPCASDVSQSEYKKLIDNAVSFLLGKRKGVLRELEARMKAKALLERYEEAAQWRDRFFAAQKAIAAVPAVEGLGGAHDQTFDVIGAAPGVGEGAIALLAVREGRLLSIERFMIAGCNDNSGEMVTAFIEQYYDDDVIIPDRIIINTELQDQEALTVWLSEKAGHKVEMYTPQRGVLARIARQADQNAKAHLTAYSTHQRENEALLERLKQFLHLEVTPRRIEAVDISNLGDKVIVASTSCLIDCEPARAEYRHYRVKTVEGQNDFASMEEIVGRRLSANREIPDLLLIDGGKGQLGMAMAVVSKLELPYSMLAALAKGPPDEVWLPNSDQPIPLPAREPVARLLRFARDEAHRFAIQYNRKKARKNNVASILDGIPGLGRVRRHLLLKVLGSPEQVLKATLEQICSIKGVGRKVGEKVYEYLHPE